MGAVECNQGCKSFVDCTEGGDMTGNVVQKFPEVVDMKTCEAKLFETSDSLEDAPEANPDHGSSGDCMNFVENGQTHPWKSKRKTSKASLVGQDLKEHEERPEERPNFRPSLRRTPTGSVQNPARYLPTAEVIEHNACCEAEALPELRMSNGLENLTGTPALLEDPPKSLKVRKAKK
eukprot:TRINITY_DN105754_c0_g1_i1.p1 TRINITY_DN105754_c0_g1~~TRINITY_DN105754_c0_g1_i1.p1  ORF type:complete len:177 (+),score=35.42 TRINITY_DN105754_c0_g1_i1:103-633(+)